MELTATTNFYTLLLSVQNSISFSLSFEGNAPHHLTDSEVVNQSRSTCIPTTNANENVSDQPVELTIHLLPEFSSLRPVIWTVQTQSERVQFRREDDARPNAVSIIYHSVHQH